MYDLAIIGAGWAGFNAAIAAKAKGLSVAIIDKNRIGGTCLNAGCIPTKALIHSAKVYSLVKKAKDFGVDLTTEPKINFADILLRKNKIVEQLGRAMESRLKGIEYFNCQAKILSSQTISLGERIISARYILIASGSLPIELPELKFDQKKIISSDQALSLPSVPKEILIVGGGAIGCEFAELFSTLGSVVTIAELKARLLPEEDEEVGRKIETIFKKKAIKVLTGADCANADSRNFPLILVCVGRKPNLSGLGLENANISLDNGRIVVDDYLKTNIPNIFAAGDCTGQSMLAHFAAHQGCIAAWNIAEPKIQKSAKIKFIPNCVFTDPEVSSIGLTEQGSLRLGIDIKVQKLDFLASGMARIIGETQGFIKFIIDKNTDKICGVSIVGPKASELIGVVGVAMQSGLSSAQLKEMIFAHPTLCESLSDVLKYW